MSEHDQPRESRGVARGGSGVGGCLPTRNLADQLTLFEPGWVEFALLPVPQIQKDIHTSVLSFKLLNCHCYNARIRRSIDMPMEVSQPDQLKRFVYFFGCTIERRYGDWCGPVVPGDAGVPHAMACHGTPRFFFGCTIERPYGDWCRPVVPRDAGVPHSVPEKYILFKKSKSGLMTFYIVPNYYIYIIWYISDLIGCALGAQWAVDCTQWAVFLT